MFRRPFSQYVVYLCKYLVYSCDSTMPPPGIQEVTTMMDSTMFQHSLTFYHGCLFVTLTASAFQLSAVSGTHHQQPTMPFSTQSPLISKGGTRELMHPRCLSWLPAGTQEVTTPSPAGPAEEDPSRGECSSGKTNHLNWLVSDLLQVATGTLSCQVIGQLKF